MEEIEKIIKMVYGFFKKKESFSFKFRCPDEETLGAFLEGRISGFKSKRIKIHILNCKRCLQVISLFDLKETRNVPAYLIERIYQIIEEKKTLPYIFEIVIRFKEKGLSIIRSGADVILGNEVLPLAVLRSKNIEELNQELSLVKELDNLRVEINLKKKEEEKLDLTVHLLDKKTLEIPKGLSVSLFKADKELESYYPVKSRLIFEGLSPGEYELRIEKDLKELGKIKLEVI
jgi:hypothetical protein